MKKLFTVFFCLFFCVFCSAQTVSQAPVATTIPPSAKHEVITSPLAIRYTFLLNNETGETWQLVSTASGRETWQKIQAEWNVRDVVPKNHVGPVYQITMSGIRASEIFLTNTLTGAVWALYRDSDTDLLFWGSLDY